MTALGCALGLALAAAPLRVLVVGDMGDPNAQQADVARGIAAAHARAPFDLAFHVGDNLYECGPDAALPGADACAFAADENTVAPGFTPPRDPSFEQKLERALAPLARSGVDLFLALGNHDVASWLGCGTAAVRGTALSRRRACLEVAHATAAWRMPGRHYVVDRGPARFVVIDSNLLTGDYGGFTMAGEVALARDAAAACAGDRPCFVVAHHPAVTAGRHRDDATAEYLARVRRVEEALGGRIAAWFAGHDHDLQHLRSPAGYDVLVSGNGSRARPRERFETLSAPGARLLFASTAPGFAELEVGTAGWSIAFRAASGEALHCCRAPPGGRCEPVACRRDGATP